MPLLGVLFYFSKTPRFIPREIVKLKLISIAILTIILPILLYYFLKSLKKVNSIYLKDTKERLIPLILNVIIIVVILGRVFTKTEIEELHYFFIGILCSTLACLFLVIFKIKASIHMIGVAGFFMFAVAICIHFKINITGTIMLMFIILGAVATSRLHLKAHTIMELIIGFFIGFFPQLIVLNYWL